MKKLALASILMVGASVAPAQAASCLGITATSPQTQSNKRFSATEISDINLNVIFADAPAGDHTVEVRIYTPKGRLYQSISAPVVFNQTGRSTARRIDGYPDPVAGARVARVKGDSAVAAVFTLPVAGTPILNNSLYGKWTAEAFVDGAAESCGPRRAFVITQ